MITHRSQAVPLPRSASCETSRLGLLATLVRCTLVCILFAGASQPARSADYVILITVDGLRSSIFSELSAAQLPNYTRVRNEGVSTLNARTDYDWTFTNPNHVSILSARPVVGTYGHKYTSTSAPPAGATLHSVAGFYVASIFDVAHDRDRRTGVYITKDTQLAIVNSSYNATNGALDITGTDNGRDKIDSYVAVDYQSQFVTNEFIAAMVAEPFHLSWLHWADPDASGHASGWISTAYQNAVIATDGYLGQLLLAIESSAVLRNRTTVIITADHGGTGFSHTDAAVAANYTIPLFVWGSDVPQKGDLYFINRPFRLDPSSSRVPYTGPAVRQPIRNIDAGNLALKLLNLPAVPGVGAVVNQAQDLRLILPVFEIITLDPEDDGRRVIWSSLGASYGYTVQACSDLTVGNWQNVPGTWPITGTTWFDPSPGTGPRYYRVNAIALPPFGTFPPTASISSKSRHLADE